jgi:hypothetical protein
MGPSPGNDSSIAWTWTSSTGGTLVVVFWAWDPVEAATSQAAQAADATADLTANDDIEPSSNRQRSAHRTRNGPVEVEVDGIY